VQYFGPPSGSSWRRVGRSPTWPGAKTFTAPDLPGQHRIPQRGAPCNGCGVEFFVAGGGELLNYFSRLEGSLFRRGHKGRWITRDPLGFDAGDSNLYRYVNNEPSNLRDPSGFYLIITQNQKERPIEFYFGEDNVEYSPISGKKGFFKVQLKEKAAWETLQIHVAGKNKDVENYAKYFYSIATNPTYPVTLKELADGWSEVTKVRDSLREIPRMNAEQARLWLRRWTAEHPVGSGFFQGDRPPKRMPAWSELSASAKARLLAFTYFSSIIRL